MADSGRDTHKPERGRRVGFKPKFRIAEISREEFESAKDDPEVKASIQEAREEGQKLKEQGLLHR